MHSPMFDLIKGYYDRGMWSVARVRNAVRAGRITAAEFTEITGEDYA